MFQLRRGIARLQAAYRAQRLALQFNLLRERLVMLQGYCRGYVTRVKLRQRRKAVVTLQSGWRRVLAKKKVEMLRREVCTCTSSIYTYASYHIRYCGRILQESDSHGYSADL